jgi:hypothetical protein
MKIRFIAKKTIYVPDVYDLTQAAAESAITNAGLVVGSVSSDYNASIDAGNVYDQDPDAGTIVNSGTSVDIDVSLGNEPIETSFLIGDNDQGFEGNPSWFPASSWINVGANGGRLYNSYTLIRNVTIPQGATITSAYVRHEQYSLENVVATTRIHAHDADDSTTPTVNQLRYSSVSSPSNGGWYLTSSSVLWTCPAGASEAPVSTPSIIDVIQEVVNRPGWSSGNDLNIIMKGQAGSDYKQLSASDWRSNQPTFFVSYTPA